MSDQSFRRRSRQAGATVLLDEAVSLFQADPVRWIARGMTPSIPLAALLILFVHLHRVVWIDRAWTGWVAASSACLAVGIVLALQIRAIGHGRLAREVAAELHPAALLDGEQSRLSTALSLVCIGTVAAALVLVGTALFALPGLLLAGFLAPLSSVVAVEGRDAGSALARANRFPRGTTGKGIMSVVLFGVLALLAWLNILLGTQLGVFGIRMLTGADVTVLSRVLGFGNEAFVLGSLVLALLALDPLWAIQRSLLYLDARLGQSGSDLLERWRALPDRLQERRPDDAKPAAATQGSWAPLVLLGVALALPVASPAAAAEDLDVYADELEGYKDQLDGQILAFGTSGFEDLSALKSTLGYGSRRDVLMRDGTVLTFDSAVLADELPDWVHTKGTELEARRVSRRLEHAIAIARYALDPEAPTAEAPTADARSLLDEELADGGYDVDVTSEAGEAYREGLQQRFRTWWEGVLRKLTWNRQPSTTPSPQRTVLPAFDGRIVMAIVAFILAVVLAVFLLAQTGRIRVGAPLGAGRAGGGPGSDLPDARQRSPLGWREHADRLAAEGLFREAIRAQFLAVLARLDRTREIDYRPERTNGEHLDTFDGMRERLGRFRGATGLFEIAWYGAVEVGGDEYGSMTGICDRLILRDARDVPAQTLVPVGEQLDG